MPFSPRCLHLDDAYAFSSSGKESIFGKLTSRFELDTNCLASYRS